MRVAISPGSRRNCVLVRTVHSLCCVLPCLYVFLQQVNERMCVNVYVDFSNNQNIHLRTP